MRIAVLSDIHGTPDSDLDYLLDDWPRLASAPMPRP